MFRLFVRCHEQEFGKASGGPGIALELKNSVINQISRKAEILRVQPIEQNQPPTKDTLKHP